MLNTDDNKFVSNESIGVSFPDVLIVQGKYQFQPPFPFSPGGEIAGIISEVGEGVADWREGDRVIAMVGNAVSYTHLTLPTTPYV